MGATASNEAASLIAGVIAGSLQKTLAKHLPLDVLTIDTGGSMGVTGTQLEAGRYVTDKLYVGYVGRIGADPTRYQNRNAVHVEYRLTVPLADRGRVRRRGALAPPISCGRRATRPSGRARALRRPQPGPRRGRARRPRGVAAGSSTANVQPAPGTERTDASPPCATAIFLTVARPRPMPGFPLFGPRTYGSNTWAPSSAGKARTVVRDLDPDARPAAILDGEGADGRCAARGGWRHT